MATGFNRNIPHNPVSSTVGIYHYTATCTDAPCITKGTRANGQIKTSMLPVDLQHNDTNDFPLPLFSVTLPQSVYFRICLSYLPLT